MTRVRVFHFIILFCLLIFSFGHEAHAAVVYALTVTATSVTGTVTLSATQGTPSATYTPSATPTSTPTTTLMPLPAITLIFPASTSTETPLPTSIESLTTPTPAGGSTLSTISPRLRLMAILIILLWVILAGFLVVYLRQFR